LLNIKVVTKGSLKGGIIIDKMSDIEKLNYLLERKKKADLLSPEIRIKFQAEYDAIVNEIETLTTSNDFYPATANETLQTKQAFNELEPTELTQSVYNRKITVNQYMDIVRGEQDPNKQLKYLVDFYKQYLLVRFKKANEYIDKGNELNPAEQQEYEMLENMINDYAEYFKSKGL
jgi:predicted metal-dependent hydrolase